MEVQVRISVSYVYKITLVGPKSKCPGFATLKEKPKGFKNSTTNKKHS